MTLSAKVLRWSLGLFVVNAMMVVIVSGLTRAGDEPQVVEKLDVEVPVTLSDPPSLPQVNQTNSATGAGAEPNSPGDGQPDSKPAIPTIPPSLGATEAERNAVGANTAGNQMVLDEILQAIRSGDQSLEVPPLNYPPLNTSSAIGMNSAGPAAVGADLGLRHVSKRIASLKQLTLAADALVRDAQTLASAGQTAEARAVLAHVSALRSMIAALASQRTSVEPVAPSVSQPLDADQGAPTLDTLPASPGA